MLVISPAASALTTTTAARLLSPRLHSMQSMPRRWTRLTRSWISARNGTTTTVTPASSMQAGAVNSKLLPPPVGRTTTSGVCLSITARSALSCSTDRKLTSAWPSACCRALQMAFSFSSSKPGPLPRSLPASGLRASLLRPRFFAPGPALNPLSPLSLLTRASSRPPAAARGASSPRKRCYRALSGRKASMERTLRCLTISIGTLYVPTPMAVVLAFCSSSTSSPSSSTSASSTSPTSSR